MGVKLTEEFVEQVSAETDILSVVSSYVPLRRKGNRYWGCCPFHHEKTASFQVKPDEGFFYCFGCHVGGNAFKFISLIENINYYEAVKRQAEKLGIPIPTAEQSPQEIARENHLNDLRKIHEMAGSFYHNCLTKTGYGKDGLEYLHGRGITDQIIEEFKLGFAPDAWNKLSTAFLKRDVPAKLLLDGGLGMMRQGGGVYDRFRNRVMIPIMDERGRIVAFGGRVLGQGEPKYLNSPETAIFNKRKLLFGLDKAKKAIQQEGFALVVEGYMDAISVYAAGVHNVVASLGTAFTQEQCRHIMRYGAELYFCYDSDAAGQNATVRGLSIARSTGAKVKVVSIPDGKDPDEFIRKHGVEAFRELLKKALPLVDFYIEYVKSKVDISRLEGKLQALNELMPLLSSIRGDNVERNVYVRKLSSLLDMDESEILNTSSRGMYRRRDNRSSIPVSIDVREDSGENKPRRQVVNQMDDKDGKAARLCIRGVWEDPALLLHLKQMLPIEYMPDWMREVLNAMSESIAVLGRPQRDDVISRLSESSAEEFSHALVEDCFDGDMFELYSKATNFLHGRYLYILFKQKSQESVEAYSRNDMTEYLRLTKEAAKIKKEMDEYKIDERINFS
ncbi:MAG: DNA primase [Selenomonadales bacterium]|nr:DNA primase [Selenomonadales bacterium]MDY3739722.1 DNA primase [Selenomonadaceae bacterium]MEE1363007.1 DNA primase [Selenomonadaceae bacterium]